MSKTEQQKLRDTCSDQLDIIVELLSLCEDPDHEFHHMLARILLPRDIDKIKAIVHKDL